MSPATIVAVEKFRLTAATAADWTVTAAVALRPPDAAVMTTTPGATPVTTPVCVTVATPFADELHDTSCPVITLPEASRTVAVRLVDCDGASVTVAGETSTVAGVGASTLTANVAVRPSLAAVIVAPPGARARITPVLLTLATDGALELQVITRSASTCPLAARVTAVTWVLLPTVSDD